MYLYMILPIYLHLPPYNTYYIPPSTSISYHTYSSVLIAAGLKCNRMSRSEAEEASADRSLSLDDIEFLLDQLQAARPLGW